MDPKFQSSFIPKGPISSTVTPSGVSMGRKVKEKSLLSFLALVIFTLSVVLAMGVFGYKFYLKYRIETMGADLERARTTLQPEVIRELTRLDNRIITSRELVAEHQILSPLFKFLEISTPKTVRFNDFSYTMNEFGIELNLMGEARGYAALALQADIFAKSGYFKNAIFSNLNLNSKGDVNFSFKGIVDPTLLSYQRAIEPISLPESLPVNNELATSTATSTSTSSPQATPN